MMTGSVVPWIWIVNVGISENVKRVREMLTVAMWKGASRRGSLRGRRACLSVCFGSFESGWKRKEVVREKIDSSVMYALGKVLD